MEQIKKNTVSAKGQLNKKKPVILENPKGTGIRVMFVGNSMTRHAAKPEIGWYGDHGMAASCIEKDYVHILMKYVKEEHPDAAFCICHCSDWERQYKTGSSILEGYCYARWFDADVIIMRLVENCPIEEFDADIFKQEYGKLVSYLNPNGKAKMIITTGFWRHIADEQIREYAKECGYPLVELGDLGDEDEMKAIGLFAHPGVANHPGDKGMQAMADRIWEKF